MARVVFTGSLKRLTGGDDALDVDAANVRQLMRGVAERYPALKPHIESGMAVAIDSQIYQDAWFQPIGPDSEVHLLPKIAGG